MREERRNRKGKNFAENSREKADVTGYRKEPAGRELIQQISEEKDGKRPREKKSLGRRALGVLGVLAVGVLFLGGVLFGAWKAVSAAGGRSLREGTASAAPFLTGDPVVLGGEDSEENPGEAPGAKWKEGWVRRGGQVYEYNDKMLNILFLGIDKEGKVSPNPDGVSGGQSDAIFLLAADTETRRVSLVGVNRDTMVEVCMEGMAEGGGDILQEAQIAVQHGFGDGMESSCRLSRDAVSALFYGLPIHGYVSFNMGGVAELNDALGGVEVIVMSGMEGCGGEWEEGSRKLLLGTDAFEYVHYRDPEEYESARLRLARQKQYLGEFVKKTAEAVRQDITLPLELYGRLRDYVVTDITLDEMVYLAGELSGYEFDGGRIYTMEGQTVQGEKFEEFYPDPGALKELILEVFYRRVDPTEYGEN